MRLLKPLKCTVNNLHFLFWPVLVLRGRCAEADLSPMATSQPVANGGLSPPKTSPFAKPFTQASTQAGRGVKTVHTVRTPTLIGDRLWRNGEPSGTDTSPFYDQIPGTDTSPFSTKCRVPTLHRFSTKCCNLPMDSVVLSCHANERCL